MEKFKIDITYVQDNRDAEHVFAKGNIDLDGNNIVEWRYNWFGPKGSGIVHLLTPDGTIDTDVEGYGGFDGGDISFAISTDVIDRIVNDSVKPVASFDNAYTKEGIEYLRRSIQWHIQAIDDLNKTEYKTIWGITAESHQKIIDGLQNKLAGCQLKKFK